MWLAAATKQVSATSSSPSSAHLASPPRYN
jgi:hypothetical protein